MKLLSKLALLVASSAAVVVGTGVQQLRGGEEDTFQQQLLGLKEGVPPSRSHGLSPGWQKNPSERQGEGHAGRRSNARKGRSKDTPRPQRKVQPLTTTSSSLAPPLTTTSSSLAPQYCTQPEGGCILRYNNQTWNENGSECEGRCYCNYVNEKNRARNGGQPAYMCSRSSGDDVSLPEDDEGGVPEELYKTATAATPTTTKASKEEAREARKAEREANRSSKSTKSPSMEREEDELTETATTATPTTTKASKEEAKEARKAERETNRGSKSTKSPSQMTAFAIA